jgi:hypothetical protein
MERDEQPKGSAMGGEIMLWFLDAGNPYDGSWDPDLSNYAEPEA